MIWREKNGFFTALDRKGKLLTWSMLNGKLLYNENQDKDGAAEKMKNYQVYRTDKTDITYTRDFYNGKDCSLSLLRSKTPMDQELAEKTAELDTRHVESKLGKIQSKNKAGLINVDKNVKQLMPNLFKPEPAHVKVDILNSQRRTEMYHFKVMELRTYEDGLEKSDLKVRFHFLFDLIKKVNRPELEQFDWNVDSKPLQRLYLSKDTTKLMEVTNNFIGTVYKRKNLDSFGKLVVGGAKAD